MVYSTGVNYTTTFFVHHPLSEIHGEPDYESLKKLKKQLKANAKAVPSTLGGGNNGLLGLVLTPAEYSIVCPTPFIKPTRPAPLSIQPLTASHDIIRLQQEHERSMDTYQDCIAVETLLKKQIVNAIDSDYLNDITDNNTDSINLAVSGILTHLFNLYGDVDAETLSTEELRLQNYYWDPAEPITILFNKIDDLMELAIAAELPKTDEQIVSLGLTLIKKTNDFENALLQWYQRHNSQKSYREFKNHFTDAKRELARVRGKKMKSTSFHQANQVAQLQTDLNIMRDELVAGFNSLADARNADTEEQQPPTEGAANASIDLNAQMLQLLQQMHQQIENLSTNNTSNNRRTTGRNTNIGRGNRGRGNSNFRGRRNVTHYCWTHGACSHPSNQCNNKASGHQDDANFTDKKGGSTYYCENT